MFMRVLAIFLMATGLAWQAWQILGQTGGELFYTLDDPYIHLSLAENILRGHYGINPGEVASPSSSILYPFLVAGGLGLGLGNFTPFVLNALPMLGVAWIMGGLFARLRPEIEPLMLLALPLLLVAVNALALPFTGMEHSMHVWASLLIVAGLIHMAETGRASVWLILGIVLAPLMRFEGFAMAGCAMLALLVWRRWSAASLAIIAVAAATVAYAVFMSRLGLPPLPSSVLVKSQASAAAVDAEASSFVVSVIQSFLAAVSNPFGVTLIMGTGLILLALGRYEPRAGRVTVALTVLAGIWGHLLLGDFSRWSRYEVYIIATLFATLLWLYAPVLRSGSRLTGFGLIVVFAGLCRLYLPFALLTPDAAQNIRDQQWQMHVFATEYFPERVAVNDLGWVSYQNEQYVLDLWGLGSEEARQMAAEGRTPEAMVALTSEQDVAYAMLYEDWFGDAIPPGWCKIAELETIRVTAARAHVAFYVIDTGREAELRAALQRFAAQSLPETDLAIFNCPSQ